MKKEKQIKPLDIESAEKAFGLQSGESYANETAYSNQEVATYRGMKILSFYDEDACQWQAWVKGIGSCYSYYDRDEAVQSASERIENELNNNPKFKQK